jgi:hypothetical protein
VVGRSSRSSLGPYGLSDDLDQDVLQTSAVKLAVKDLLLRAKDFDELSRVVQSPIPDCYDDLAAYHLSLQMDVTFVPSAPLRTGLAGAVVTVAADRCRTNGTTGLSHKASSFVQGR